MNNNQKIFGLYFAAFMAFIIFGSNSSNPPDARTNAPFNSFCTGCHTPNLNINGTVSISGLPDTIQGGETYSLMIEAQVTEGNPVRAGFQLVSVFEADNLNAGTFIESSSALGINTRDNRDYIEHRGAQNFVEGVANWSFDWQAPAAPSGAVVKMYYAANITNGNGGSTGDRPVSSSSTYTLIGQDSDLAINILGGNAMCGNQNSGSATAEVLGGVMPYSYNWSTGDTTPSIDGLSIGTYFLTITDSNLDSLVDSVSILSQDSIGPVLPTNNIVVYLDSMGLAEIDPFLLILDRVTDNCQLQTVEATVGDVDCARLGINEIEVRALDASGNESIGNVIVEIKDTSAPYFICDGDIEVATGDTVTYSIPEAFDNCGIDSLVLAEGLASGSIFPSGETKVSYMATDNSGNISCCSFFVRVSGTTTSTIDRELESSIRAYPNPVTDELTIEYTLPSSASTEVQLIASDGRLIRTFRNGVNLRIQQINLNELTQGIYILKIIQGDRVALKKIQKL